MTKNSIYNAAKNKQVKGIVFLFCCCLVALYICLSVHENTPNNFQVTEPACLYWRYQRKEEGKDQESIQSSTTPDPGHGIEK